MGRAELRRAAREKKKAETATYNFTREQLDSYIADKISEVRQQAAEEAVNTAMILLLTLPLEVLMDHYWTKSYEKKIPEFTMYVLEYFEKWQDGELDMDELQEDLWEYAGIRLEEER